MIYTVAQLAEMFQVSDETIYKWMRTGLLHSVKAGKVRRITDGQLRDFLAAQETTAF